MSGIVCILHLDHSPVDPRLLRKLTDFQRFRGPDAHRIWLDGAVGLGHTLLKSTEEAEHEQQPCSLNGKVWIAADARVDGRKDLIDELESHGRVVPAGVTDAELILHAYAVWDENCVEHLLGDFAFAIWDGPKGRLFCARDQMSVRPLFYAHVGNTVVVANTLDCIRQHPAVSNKLNETVVGDFLVFESIPDTSASFFADIHRVPGGHCVSWDGSGFHRRRYWTLPIDEPIFYRRQEDYVDRFQELLRQAVGDRLRSDRVAIYMSGGRDSTSIAATACGLLQERASPSELKAFTTIDSALPEEGHFAGLVAERLRIPIDYYPLNEDTVQPDWERFPFHTPEPDVNLPLTPAYQKRHQGVAAFARVCLEGEGADNALIYEWIPYLSYLLRQGHYGRLASGFASDLIARPRIPFWGRLARKAQKMISREGDSPFPRWIHPDFISRAGLNHRWEVYWAEETSRHPIRPGAYNSLLSPIFQAFPELYDTSRTMAAMDVRHPFLDIRILRFLLAVPVIPWCRSKYIIRRAMRAKLPDTVLQRPKATASCGFTMHRFARGICNQAPLAPEFRTFVDPGLLPQALDDNDHADFNNGLRARIFNHWLQNSYKTGTLSQ